MLNSDSQKMNAECGSFTLVRNPFIYSYIEFSATQHKLLENLLGTGAVGFSWRG
jgi:hypothetical protein